MGTKKIVEEFSTPRWDDFHAHLRDGPLVPGPMLEDMVRASQYFGRVLVMPNTSETGIRRVQEMVAYRGRIDDVRAHLKNPFEPLMTIKIDEGTTPDIVIEARRAGAVAGKGYPVGVTTGSSQGIRNFANRRDVFRAMEECGMVLSLHGEMPGPYLLPTQREEAFLEVLFMLVRQFPKLRIVLEHITTKAALDAVLALPDTVAATITIHHLILIFNDVVDAKMYPHNFCKPIAKSIRDRDALVHAVLRGRNKTWRPKLMLGTDSASHNAEAKECSECCAGCFTANDGIGILTTLFEQFESLPALPDFVSGAGHEFYQLPAPKGEMYLKRIPYEIPQMYAGVVPFMAGKRIAWQVAGVS